MIKFNKFISLIFILDITNGLNPSFIKKTISLNPLISSKSPVSSLHTDVDLSHRSLHQLSLRLCGSKAEKSNSEYPSWPRASMGGITLKDDFKCSPITFTTSPPPLLEESDVKVELRDGERMVFFSFDVSGTMELCCVRTCDNFDRRVERKVVGGIVIKREGKEIGEDEDEGGGEVGDGELPGDVLAELQRDRDKRDRKKSKKQKRKRDNEVFSVKDVQKLVDIQAEGDEIRELLRSEMESNFELIDDPPPPHSTVQIDGDTVDAGELFVQIIAGGVEPFPKKEGSDKVKLTFEF